LGSLITKLKTANVYEKINIVIVSDHGMTNFKSDNLILIQNYLNGSTIASDKTVYGIVSNIHPIPGAVSIIFNFQFLYRHLNLKETYVYERLKAIPNLDVFWKNEVPIEYNYRNNRRIAPIVVIAHEGYRLLV
jgi:ectonucleotide pyrophosphatase/phosphodiesterase family protein 5